MTSETSGSQQSGTVSSEKLINLPYRTILETADAGFWVVDLQGHFIDVNQAYCDMIGYSRPELLQMQISDIEAVEKRAETRLRIQKVIKVGKDSFTSRHTRKDGTKIDVAIRANFLDVNSGCIFVFVQDISEQLAIEQKVRESENLYRLIAENSVDVIWILDTRLKFTYVSPSIYPMTGYSVDEWLGSHLWEHASRSEFWKMARLAVKSLRANKDFENVFFEARMLRKNGAEFPVEITSKLLRSEKGLPIGLQGTTRDITKRKETEALLQQADIARRREWERFLAIMGSFPEVLYVADPKTYEVLLVNRVLQDTLGYNPVGKICYQVFQGLDQPCEFCTNPIILETRQPHTWEYHNPVLHRDYLITDQIIPWPDGRDVRFEVATDITDRIQAEQALQEMLTKLERSNLELEQFAYIASHDLQEPLRMVSSYLQLLQRRYQDQLDEPAHEFIEFAVDGAVRMKQLINDLLKYSRLNTKSAEFDTINSQQILADVLQMLSHRIVETHAVITHDPMPVICVDSGQFQQVLQNLISNALKFHAETPPRIHIGVQDQGAEWLFSVADNGIGIDPKFAERIFVIFHRLHPAADYPGTGLGLAIVKKVVERHGGQIWVESLPEQGATFYFTLPKQRAD